MNSQKILSVLVYHFLLVSNCSSRILRSDKKHQDFCHRTLFPKQCCLAHNSKLDLRYFFFLKLFKQVNEIIEIRKVRTKGLETQDSLQEQAVADWCITQFVMIFRGRLIFFLQANPIAKPQRPTSIFPSIRKGELKLAQRSLRVCSTLHFAYDSSGPTSGCTDKFWL